MEKIIIILTFGFYGRNWDVCIIKSVDMTMISRMCKRFAQAVDLDADKRIYCDCELSLLREDNSAHEAVLGFLVAAHKRGYEIILISTNVNFVQFAVEDCLIDNGFAPDFFGDVKTKDSAFGHSAFIVIDDKPWSVEGIKTKDVLLPDDPRIAGMTRQLEAGQPLMMPRAS